MKVNDNNITDFLIEFQKNPYQYIRTYSYDEFLLFFHGYLLCEIKVNPSIKLFIEGFKEYVCEFYNIKNCIYNELNIIKFFSSSDEEAFTTLFDLFNSFAKGDSYNRQPLKINKFVNIINNRPHIIKPNALLRQLEKIREHPILVGSPPSFHTLLNLLFSVKHNGCDEYNFIMLLTDYIFNFFQIEHAVRPSLTIIDLFTDSDEAAFYKFYELLDEFLETQKLSTI